MLDLFVEYCLDASTHLSDDVIHTVERGTVVENEFDIIDKFICIEVGRASDSRIGFRGIGRDQISFDGTKIHRLLDDGRVMGNAKYDRINRVKKWDGIFEFFESTDGGETEAMLSC